MIQQKYKIKQVFFSTSKIKTLTLRIPILKRKYKRKENLAMTERERSVLEYRFGLIDGQKRSLAEVGRQFNVSRERIRQIEANALRKIGYNKKRWTRPAQISISNL